MEYRARKGWVAYVKNVASAPFIFGMAVPFVFLDICLELYHRVCFPLYGLAYVRRSDYIKIDRHKLKYLTFKEKMGCLYCGYANGLLHYASVIAGITEKYWCGIMHQKHQGFVPPPHHKDFVEYGDEAAFYKKYGR